MMLVGRLIGENIQLELCPTGCSAGEIIGTQGTAHDITDHKTMEEQLRQAQKMEAVGHLAGGVAHDFNNMLQIIQGYTELTILNGRQNGLNVDSMEKVLASAKRAGNLTRQLLAFSRQNVLQPVDINLNDLIEDLMMLVGRLIGENIQLELCPGSNLGNVYADAGMIEQVLMNLCVNARDAMPEGGRLTIETANLIVDEAYCQELPRGKPHAATLGFQPAKCAAAR